MHSIVTTFRGADIKVAVANFCAAMDTLIDQDDKELTSGCITDLQGSDTTWELRMTMDIVPSIYREIREMRYLKKNDLTS